MYNPIKAYFEYRLEKARIQAESTNKPFEMMREVVASQGEIMNKWLEGFKVTNIDTSSTVVRELDEYNQEIAREAKEGIVLDNDFDISTDLFNRLYNT